MKLKILKFKKQPRRANRQSDPIRHFFKFWKIEISNMKKIEKNSVWGVFFNFFDVGIIIKKKINKKGTAHGNDKSLEPWDTTRREWRVKIKKTQKQFWKDIFKRYFWFFSCFVICKLKKKTISRWSVRRPATCPFTPTSVRVAFFF